MGKYTKSLNQLNFKINNSILSRNKFPTYSFNNSKHNSFILHDGPPYANGNLHIGHALNKILKDFSLRYHHLLGSSVNFIPGWDCHGLPIEQACESKDERNIRKKCKDHAEKFIEMQLDGFKKLSIFSNWDSSYITMKPSFQVQELDIFSQINEKGMISRQLMPLYFSPFSKSVVSKTDVEYNPDHLGTSLLFLVKLSDTLNGSPVFVPIFTTTPWTLVSNSAIAYNKAIKYVLAKRNSDGAGFIFGESFRTKFLELNSTEDFEIFPLPTKYLDDAEYNHPMIAGERLKFYHGSFVEDEFGTGLVHIAPAHGKDDYSLAQTYRLKFKNYVDPNGMYASNCPLDLNDKSIYDPSIEPTILAHLKDSVLEYKKTKQNYPYEWRTKKPVVTILSEQWFMDLETVIPKALDSLREVQVYPAAFKGTLEQYISSRNKWCISRQRNWGLPIPVYFCRETKKPFLDKDYISFISDRIAEKNGSDFWWHDSDAELVPEKFLKKWDRSISSLERGRDIFDVWFDSGTSWNHLFPNEQADLYLEGPDQFRGWFSASLLLSVAARGQSPFKNLAVHGFVVDSKGNKMSKSLGNVISIEDVLEKSNGQPDVLRSWVAHSSLNQKCNISMNMIERYNEVYKSLFNKFRFVCALTSELNFQENPAIKYLFNLIYNEEENVSFHSSNVNSSSLDQVFINKLSEIIDNALNENLPKFQYQLILNDLIDLMESFSTIYLSAVKDVIYCHQPNDERRVQVVQTSWLILEGVKGLLSILMPNLVENVDQVMRQSFKVKDESYILRMSNSRPGIKSNWHHLLECLVALKKHDNEPRFNEAFRNVLMVKDALSKYVVKDDSIPKSSTNPLLRLSIFLDERSLDKFGMFTTVTAYPDHFSDLTLALRCASVEFVSKEKMNEISIQCRIDSDQTVGIKVAEEDSLCPRCRRYIKNAYSVLCFRCEDYMG